MTHCVIPWPPYHCSAHETLLLIISPPSPVAFTIYMSAQSCTGAKSFNEVACCDYEGMLSYHVVAFFSIPITFKEKAQLTHHMH